MMWISLIDQKLNPLKNYSYLVKQKPLSASSIYQNVVLENFWPCVDYSKPRSSSLDLGIAMSWLLNPTWSQKWKDADQTFCASHYRNMRTLQYFLKFTQVKQTDKCLRKTNIFSCRRHWVDVPRNVTVRLLTSRSSSAWTTSRLSTSRPESRWRTSRCLSSVSARVSLSFLSVFLQTPFTLILRIIR